jgi:ribokinase
VNDTPNRRVVAVGQIACDVALRVEAVPGQGCSAAVTERLEMLGGNGASQAVSMAQLGLDVSLIAAVGDDEAGGWRYLEHIPPAVLVTPGDIQRAAPAFDYAGTVVIQLQQPAQTALAAAALGRQRGCRVVLDGAPPQEYRERLLATSDVVRADAREADGRRS